MKIFFTGLMIIFLMLCINAQSFAGTTFYGDKAAWTSAVSSITTENYESYGWSSADRKLLVDNGTASLGGISYSFPQRIYGVGSALTYDATYLSGAYLEWQSSPNPFTITLPNSVKAVAFDYGDFYGFPGRIFSIMLGNGDKTSVSTTNNSYAFFGAISDTSFNIITLNASMDFALIDNLSFGNPVPIPAAAWLLGSGLLGLFGVRRKIAK